MQIGLFYNVPFKTYPRDKHTEYFLPSTECKRDELELPMASQCKMFLSHSIVSKSIQTLLFSSNNLCLMTPGYHSCGPGLH